MNSLASHFDAVLHRKIAKRSTTSFNKISAIEAASSKVVPAATLAMRNESEDAVGRTPKIVLVQVTFGAPLVHFLFTYFSVGAFFRIRFDDYWKFLLKTCSFVKVFLSTCKLPVHFFLFCCLQHRLINCRGMWPAGSRMSCSLLYSYDRRHFLCQALFRFDSRSFRQHLLFLSLRLLSLSLRSFGTVYCSALLRVWSSWRGIEDGACARWSMDTDCMLLISSMELNYLLHFFRYGLLLPAWSVLCRCFQYGIGRGVVWCPKG